MHRSVKIATAVFMGAFASFVGVGTPATAQLYNPCPYTNDGDCDEPNGLGYCAWGTDTADCSNPNSNFGSGGGYSGSGGSTAGTGGGSASSGLYNPCPYTNDGDCDEPNGLGYCAWGTDTADCSNPNSNYGSGSGYSGGSGASSGGGGGAGGGAVTTFYPWRTFTRQMGQFAAQPGNTWPLSPNGSMYCQPGNYTVFTGIVENGQIRNIESHSVTMMPNERYLAAASSMGFLSFRTDATLITYSPPAPGMAMVYGRNDDIQYDRAICILPAGWPMSSCG